MTRSRRWLKAAAVAATAALLATACGDDSETSGSSATPVPSGGGSGSAEETCTAERVGGVATVGTYAEAPGLDPAVGGGTGLDMGLAGGTEAAAIYDVLVIYDEVSGEYKPHLAEELTANDDATEWTLRLRSGINFDNGDPFDAEAVATSIKRHVAEGSRSTMRRGVVLIEDYEIVDDLTLVFHLAEPWGDFPMILATSPGMITNQALIDERGENFNVNAVGGGVGPYVIERFTPGEGLVLKARDNYWGGPVCIEELRFINMGGGPLTFEALEAGQVDTAFLPDGATIARARDAGYDGLTWIINAGSGVMINHGVSESPTPTADVRVRQAVAHALNPDAINERQFDGYGLPTSAIIHPDSTLSPGIDGPKYDVERAKQLVEEVKAETGWDGTIRLLCNDLPDRRNAAMAVEALLNSAGMKVDRTIGDTAALISGVITKKDYDLACWSINLTDADAWFNLSIFSSNSPTNYAGIKDPEIDDALGALKAARTTDERQAALGELQERWNEVVPAALWGGAETFIAQSERIHGVVPTVRQMQLFHDAYVD